MFIEYYIPNNGNNLLINNKNSLFKENNSHWGGNSVRKEGEEITNIEWCISNSLRSPGRKQLWLFIVGLLVIRRAETWYFSDRQPGSDCLPFWLYVN